jgi:hypothetical protein
LGFVTQSFNGFDVQPPNMWVQVASAEATTPEYVVEWELRCKCFGSAVKFDDGFGGEVAAYHVEQFGG